MKKTVLFMTLVSLYFYIPAQQTDSIIDSRDGLVYKTVKIGNQWWMAENLWANIYSDGTPLVNGNFAGDISGDFTTKYYFWYNNDSASYAEKYGALYTWAAAMNGLASSGSNPSTIQGVCPTGWHLPSDAEWKKLEMSLGMSQTQADSTGLRGTYEGGKLKETGTLYWKTPNEGATNESGFTALPGGVRNKGGGFGNLHDDAYFWSSTERDDNNNYVWWRGLNFEYSQVNRYNGGVYTKDFGFSVRCIKDSLPTDSLIAYYPFNGDANDESGNRNHGIVYGATPTIDRLGNLNSAYLFDGVDDYIKIPYDVTLTPSNFTISLWIKRGIMNLPRSECFFDYNGAGTDPPYDPLHIWFYSGTNNVRTDIRGDNDTKTIQLESQTTLDTIGWHHICILYEESSGKAALFLNGEKEDSAILSMVLSYNNLGIILGSEQLANGTPNPEWHFKGALDDIRIFNRTLLESEIDSLYQEGGYIILDMEINHVSCYGEADGSVELTPVNGMAPYSFTWSTGDTTSWIDGLSAGEYSVFITDANDSTVRYEIILINEPLPITISSLDYDTITCFGDFTGVINLLASGGTGNLLYSLSDNISWQENGTFTGLVAGEYVVSIIDDSNCMINSDTIIITQNDHLASLVINGKTEVDEYEQTAYSVSQTPGSQYEWLATGGNIISGQTTNAITIHWGNTDMGKIGVIETTVEGCTGDTAWLSVNIGGLYNNQISIGGFSIFPNPLTDQTTIQFHNPSNNKFQLLIYNLQGQVIHKVDNVFSNNIVIDSKNLKNGIFLVELRGPSIYRGKIIVE
jgi:uncharacterized protein (TIGR02145 family)